MRPGVQASARYAAAPGRLERAERSRIVHDKSATANRDSRARLRPREVTVTLPIVQDELIRSRKANDAARMPRRSPNMHPARRLSRRALKLVQSTTPVDLVGGVRSRASEDVTAGAVSTDAACWDQARSRPFAAGFLSKRLRSAGAPRAATLRGQNQASSWLR